MNTIAKASLNFTIFKFGENEIRTINKDGEPWFVAKDVCDALGIANNRDSISRLDDDEKSTVGLTDAQAGHGSQNISLISESGMYTLILRCRDAIKPGTIPYKFRKWVTAEVLPAIRKTGKYAPNESTALATSPRPTDRTLISRINGKLVAADDISLTAIVAEPSQIASYISEPFFTVNDIAAIAEAAVKRLSELSSRAIARR